MKLTFGKLGKQAPKTLRLPAITSKHKLVYLKSTSLTVCLCTVFQRKLAYMHVVSQAFQHFPPLPPLIPKALLSKDVLSECFLFFFSSFFLFVADFLLQ